MYAELAKETTPLATTLILRQVSLTEGQVLEMIPDTLEGYISIAADIF